MIENFEQLQAKIESIRDSVIGYKYAIDLTAQPIGMYIVNIKNTTQGIDSNFKVVLN